MVDFMKMGQEAFAKHQGKQSTTTTTTAAPTATATNSTMGGTAAVDQPDKFDNAVDGAYTRVTGKQMTTGQRGMREKITDAVRKMFTKQTGKQVPASISN